VLGKSEDGKNDINSPVNAKYVTVVTKKATVTAKPAAKPADDAKKKKITAWQKAAIADGFKFPKYGADGAWGDESVAVAKKAVCKKQLVYKNKNLTKFLQGQLGITADGKFGAGTKTAVINYQKKNRLTADGVVGLNTWKKILGV
jgi:peptidoglycan hydrolase-like protein with peptidoglycan-binding domain